MTASRAVGSPAVQPMDGGLSLVGLIAVMVVAAIRAAAVPAIISTG